MNREVFIKKNIIYSAINYVMVNGLRFLVRMAFIRNLSIELLGINGLFTNVLTMLSLAELGIGPAIVFSLYKPLAVKDRKNIMGIMSFFKSVYIRIGIVIFGVGLLISPFLNFFIKDNVASDNLLIYYLVFLLNTSISYFWSYNRNLLIADQKQFVVNKFQMFSQILMSVIQIVVLYLFQSFIAFLIVMVLSTVFENFIISRKVLEEYPFLKNNFEIIDIKIKTKILQNTKAMIIHKIAGIAAASSATIVISKFLGLAVLGIYSNYYMIITAFNKLANKFFEAITASVGNLVAVGSESEKRRSFLIAQFITALQASIVTVILLVSLNDFVQIWLGKGFLLEEIDIRLMIALFYINYMRNAVLMFKVASGLFWNDRYKAIAEAFLNIGISVFLVNYYGLRGVLVAGILSIMLTCFWVEPFVLFKNSVDYNLMKYYKDYFYYTCCTVVAYFLAWLLCSFVTIETLWLKIIVDTIISFIITISTWYVFFGKTEMFQYLYIKFFSLVKLKSS